MLVGGAAGRALAVNWGLYSCFWIPQVYPKCLECLAAWWVSESWLVSARSAQLAPEFVCEGAGPGADVRLVGIEATRFGACCLLSSTMSLWPIERQSLRGSFWPTLLSWFASCWLVLLLARLTEKLRVGCVSACMWVGLLWCALSLCFVSRALELPACLPQHVLRALADWSRMCAVAMALLLA